MSINPAQRYNLLLSAFTAVAELSQRPDVIFVK